MDPRGPSNFDRKVCIGPTRAASFAGSFVTSSFQLFSPSSSSSSYSSSLSLLQPPFFALFPFLDRCMYVQWSLFFSFFASLIRRRARLALPDHEVSQLDEPPTSRRSRAVLGFCCTSCSTKFDCSYLRITLTPPFHSNVIRFLTSSFAAYFLVSFKLLALFFELLSLAGISSPS